MKVKTYILFTVLFLFAGYSALADYPPSREYQLKAAFLYNFMVFVDWPAEKLTDSNEPVTIGIIGNDPFGSAFEPIKNEKIKGRSIVIKQFESFEKLKNPTDKGKPESNQEIEALTKCCLLFICSSEQKNLKEIIDAMKDHGVLTVGEMKGFLESGGIINWFVEEDMIRFEINNAAAKQAKIGIRSSLLRLAKRVVE